MMIAPLHPNAMAAPKPDVKSTVQHMAGMLWYEMLSSMNENGMDTGALGAGAGDFQSMFLWNMAQNDFGKYDSGLLAAATRQIGGAQAAAAAPEAVPPAILLPDAETAGLGPLAPVSMAPLGAVPDIAPPPGDLLTQAKKFAKQVWPQITQAAATLGVPAVAVLAQTALETGWGTSAPGNNLFGIKANSGEAGSSRPTHEMVDGVLTPQTASFRDYASVAGSVADYVGLIQNGYQAATGQSDVAGFAQALQQGGYATDTNYAAKIINIAQSPLMAAVLQAVNGAAQAPAKTGGP